MAYFAYSAPLHCLSENLAKAESDRIQRFLHMAHVVGRYKMLLKIS